jgi:hypothetical protein
MGVAEITAQSREDLHQVGRQHIRDVRVTEPVIGPVTGHLLAQGRDSGDDHLVKIGFQLVDQPVESRGRR